MTALSPLPALAGDVSFDAPGPLGAVWQSARERLERCIVSIEGRDPILHEGAIYGGAWVESTASICCEVLARFRPEVATQTVRRILSQPREDGLLPYKVTPDGPAYRQIQMVTPLARSVRVVAALASDPGLVAEAYPALAAHDAWLARHRDTRGTGGVEAFCTYDTGHDRSPRFWHVPDSCPDGDPTRWDADNPRLPFVAPDLTANVACQRRHLAVMASEWGEDPEPWLRAASASEEALWQHCWHEDDRTFYDLDAQGHPVRVSSDVLLRVLACEVGNDAFFAAALERHLLDTRRFFAAYPFTSVSMDDPRFDPHVDQNSWAGPTNLLSLIRAPEAFERHGRHTELTWALWPTVAALAREVRFAQTLDPWVGTQGFSSDYAPAILTLLDFVERGCGVLPRPDGRVWVTGAAVPQVQHDVPPTGTSYARTVRGVRYAVTVTAGQATLTRDGAPAARWPAGLRLVLDAASALLEVVGVVARTVTGRLEYEGRSVDVAVAGNERWSWDEGRLTRVSAPGVISPR